MVAKYIIKFPKLLNLTIWHNIALIVYLRRDFKYNIKNKIIYNRRKLDNLNSLIKVIIKLNNKFYKLVLEIYYNNSNNKVRFY